ncbi:SH3 domain-containing protein [Streptomyces sp. NBC_00102]|uniref:SH3 domain-containing protein n=1 Tax=Streptomyces sp. NBC_00102 TaxID=2975652 RepID=UPI00224E9AD8|nr:SH3 domain-containing protein [Streptomyces sp. NBC_00102]MCX5395616.1 SH3 domain-containing protein [Streptomyces sp. NBC_00102]
MRSTRTAVTAAVLGALVLPVLGAGTASAATPDVVPASSCSSQPPLPYTVHTTAVIIRSRASATSTALGVLYKAHTFSVSKKSGNWVYITDKTTGVTGWVSGTYVYRDARMCLD